MQIDQYRPYTYQRKAGSLYLNWPCRESSYKRKGGGEGEIRQDLEPFGNNSILIIFKYQPNADSKLDYYIDWNQKPKN